MDGQAADGEARTTTGVRTLFIFPHAGGTATDYAPFSRAFTGDMKRIAIQYPGRANRHDVPDLESISALAGDIYGLLAPKLPDTGVAFFGHSMGGLIAFDIARRLEQAGKSIAALFVSASPAPGHGGYEHLHQGSDSELLKMVNELTGTQSDFIDDTFGATILRTLRNYGAITQYDCPPGTTLNCPIYAYAAADDGAVSRDSVKAWSKFTTAGSGFRVLDGDHFFITRDVSDIVDDIQRVIAGAEENPA